MNDTVPNKDQKVIMLFIQGGAGDVLAQTSVVRCMRKDYPDDFIIVLSTYAQLWEGNKNVDRFIYLSDPDPRDYYEQFVRQNKLRFIRKRFIYDYYYEHGFALGAKNLPDFACTCYGTVYDGNKPDYVISDYEDRAAKVFMNQTKKPKVLIHVSGAVPSDGGYGILPCADCGGRGLDKEGNKCKVCGGSGKIVQMNKTNMMKDLDPEKIAPIIEKYKEKYDFLQIGLEGEPVVPGAIDCLGMKMRETIALIKYADSFIFIESLFMHAAGALGKTGVVIGHHTDLSFFGYDIHHHVTNAGGCKEWPCGRTIGPLPDMFAGFENPKTREAVPWRCKEQLCATAITTEQIEEVFLKSFDGAPRKDDGHNTLEGALKSGGKKKKKVKKKTELELVRNEDKGTQEILDNE